MKNVLSILLLAVAIPLGAANPHQVRIGWGDMLFETLAFHAGYGSDGLRKSGFGYTGHIFAEYRYRLTPVVGLAAKTDFEGIFWKETPCDIYRQPSGETTSSRNYNLCFIPNVQFTFLDREAVELYAGIGAGLLVAFDNAGGSGLAPAIDFNLIGVRFGKGPWCGAVELGGLNALTGANNIYMISSRILSVSLNYRW